MYTMYKNLMKSKGKAILFAAFIALSLLQAPKAYSQGAVTLRNPLVSGASSQMPLVPAPRGFAPAPGSGPTSLPPPVGMIGSPTLIPSIPAMPSNNIGSGFSGIGLPISPATALPPGVWGPLLTPFIPNSPSTPGVARPMLQGFSNPAAASVVQPTGGYAGTGGYYSTIPKIRRLGTNKSVQYERRGRYSVFGGGGNAQDGVTQFGPLAGFGLINGVPTGPGYNKGPAGSNSDNFNKSIDLGGGMRTKVGGQVLSTGKTVQDLNGYNVLYNNGVPGLGAHLSTEFGQGARTAYSSVGRIPNRSTDFGFPLRPQTGLNAHPNEPGRFLPQQAVLTNF
jgi:hypothetical protein